MRQEPGGSRMDRSKAKAGCRAEGGWFREPKLLKTVLVSGFIRNPEEEQVQKAWKCKG